MTLFKVAVSKPKALSLTVWVATTPTLSCKAVSRERAVDREAQRERETVRRVKNRYHDT